MCPLCVLDFYVHESHQRQGCGRKLFDFMLQSEDIKPSRLAIDLPSKKMIQFLHKHYHLINPIHLANNFVIYPGFFDNILYESVNTEKQSTIQSKLSPVEIQDLKKNVVNKNKMDPTLNTLYNKTNSHDNGPVCNKQTISSGKINDDSFITNIKPNSRQMHQLHTRIPEMPTNLMIIRPHDSSGRVWDVPIKTNEQNELNQQKAEMKGAVQDNVGEVKKCEVFTIVNSPKSQMRVKYSTLSNSQLCNYQPMMLQNPAKSSYSYISAVRNHNGHTRLW
ncbi:unnamed protein product [Heterobilharzia americana]|nr:unnamed protein product [Heterobilharzia americana]